MNSELWSLYRLMLRSRLFEHAVAQLWQEGKISGEMHLGLGEEAIAAGVVAHLQEGDALALDHRGTPPLLMRGVDPISLLREFLGHSEGLCRGKGGHMHLFSKGHLAASSGIVGASGPAGVGFALAAQYLRPGAIAVAFFGESAVNQGMLMEAMNLAAAWKLPLLFVCKDNAWAITTLSRTSTGGSLLDRARAFGLKSDAVDGTDVEAVWDAAGALVSQVRHGSGPCFLLASCSHLDGHMMGDRLLRITRHPTREIRTIGIPLTRAIFTLRGAPLRQRLDALGTIVSLMRRAARDDSVDARDPLKNARHLLMEDTARLERLEAELATEIEQVVRHATRVA